VFVSLLLQKKQQQKLIVVPLKDTLLPLIHLMAPQLLMQILLLEQFVESGLVVVS
jgi:hypothetical protein